MATANFSSQLPRQETSYFHYLPLVSAPAVKAGEYVVDDQVAFARVVTGMALTWIFMAAAYWTCPPVALVAAKYESLAILGSIAFSYLPGILDIWRSSRAADERAVEEYTTQQTPSTKATDRLCSSERAFRLLMSSPANLHKMDNAGQALAKKILTSYQTSSAVIRAFTDLAEIDFFKADQDGATPFDHVVGHITNQDLQYILASLREKIQGLSETQQARVWKNVNRDSTAAMLCRYGVNIDAIDEQGQTELMRRVKEDEDIEVLLNAGANPTITNNEGKKASELAEPHSVQQLLLLQAEMQWGLKDSLQLPQESKWTAWFPWKPGVRNNGLVYDDLGFGRTIWRMCLIWVAVFACVAIAPSGIGLAVAASDGFFLGLSGALISFMFIEVRRNHKEVQRQAVVDFLQNPVPSKAATFTISYHIEAARLLVAHTQDRRLLNKLDKEGDSLLSDAIFDPEVFKFLVENGTDIFAGGQKSGFLMAVKNTACDCLAYILDKKLVNKDEMSKKLQIEMWCSIGSKQSAQFLTEYGFNPDIQDEEGNTALMLLAASKDQWSFMHIHTLLSIGANKDLQNKQGQTALSLAGDEQVRQLLQQEAF